MQLDRRSPSYGALRALLFLGLLASGLTLGSGSIAAEPRDGAIFVGAVPGDATSSGQLILEKNFRQTKLLRWQSTDAALGQVDSDFFQPRGWQIQDDPFEELSFMDRSPDPAMRGKVMLVAPDKALVEIVVGDEMSSYQLVRADIGLRFAGVASQAGDAEVARNPLPISSANLASQRCHMRVLRVNGLGRAVLDDTNDGVVEIFNLEGQKLSLPAKLESLPIVLLVSGKRLGTTALRVDYVLPNHSTLEQETAVHVRGEIAEGQGCPERAGK